MTLRWPTTRGGIGAREVRRLGDVMDGESKGPLWGTENRGSIRPRKRRWSEIFAVDIPTKATITTGEGLKGWISREKGMRRHRPTGVSTGQAIKKGGEEKSRGRAKKEKAPKEKRGGEGRGGHLSMSVPQYVEKTVCKRGNASRRDWEEGRIGGGKGGPTRQLEA